MRQNGQRHKIVTLHSESELNSGTTVLAFLEDFHNDMFTMTVHQFPPIKGSLAAT